MSRGGLDLNDLIKTLRDVELTSPFHQSAPLFSGGRVNRSSAPFSAFEALSPSPHDVFLHKIPGTFAECHIVESLLMVDMVEDWSGVRSPSRARRRLRQGHKQNIRMVAVPKPDVLSMDGGRSLVMHPEIARKLERMVEQQITEGLEDALMGRAR